MAHITHQELVKLAQIAHITLHDQDVDRLVKEIGEILAYAAFLKEIAQGQEPAPMPQNINIWRTDTVIKTAPEPLLALAPERQENYYVVPVIVKSPS